jgi:hypothetical protein
MNNKTIILVMIILSIITLTTAGGCTSKEVTETAASPARQASTAMLKIVPADYESFQFWDVTALSTDKDLAEMYGVWRERRGEWLSTFGIPEGAADYVVEAGVLTLASGSLSLPDIRDRLSDNYQRNTAYKAEVWSAKNPPEPQTTGGSVLLRDGFFAWGNAFNIDDHLSAASGEKSSMYNTNTTLLLEKLPESFVIRVWHPGYPAGLQVYADSVTKKEGQRLLWTSVYKLEEGAAQTSQVQEYFHKIEKDFKDGEQALKDRDSPVPFHDFKITRDGDYVTWSVVVEEQYMIALLFYG